MTEAGSAGMPAREKVRLVEIIGPAGVGKTSLYTALGQYPEQIRLSNFPDVHKLSDAPFFVRYGLQFFPSLARYSRRESRQFSRREFAWMSILIGWPHILQGQLKESPHVIVLDQGPVYLLAEMKEFGPAYIQAARAEEFWQNLYGRWARTLDLIVWLDAENGCLLERIRGREQDHIVKNEADSKMIEFLECYRRIFDSTVSALRTANPGIKVIRFDTGRLKTEQILEALLKELDLP